MTTTFTPDAQQLFDRYLQTVRWSVRGVADPNEIERDVREHVSSALEQHGEAVSSQTLRDVLSRLGDPWEWVPMETLPIWRRIMMRFSLGPEDWRLAYACFGLTLLGFLLMPVGIGFFILLAAYCLARATYELASERQNSLGARRWLVYPILALFALIIAGMIFVGGAAPILGWGIGDRGFLSIFDDSGFNLNQPLQNAMFVFACAALTVGAWWIVLSAILALAMRPVRFILTPFANGLRRVHTLWLTAVGVVTAGAGAAILFTH